MAKLHHCSRLALCVALSSACSSEPAQQDKIGTTAQPLTAYELDGGFETPGSFHVPPGQNGFDWRYTFQAPGPGWEAEDFDDNSWPTGKGSFNYGGTQPGDDPNTAWPESASELWARSTFELTAAQIDDLMFWGRWDDSIKIYINGEKAVELREWANTYRYLGLSEAARGKLRPGQNTIAVYVEDKTGGKHMDVGLTLSPQMANLPVESDANSPEFAPVTELMRREMSEHGISAGVMALGVGTHEDARIVLSQGFGYMDKQFSRHVPPDAVFRLASLDKPITEDVIHHLIAEPGSQLEYSTKVWDVFQAHGVTPAGGVHDSRIEEVTVQQLLDHTSGVGELPGEHELDQFYADLAVAPGTSTREDNIRWILSQPLEWDPGEPTEAKPYSSAGFMMLRYIVELLRGDLLHYMQDVVLEPTGLPDIFVAAQRLDNRIKYSDESLREPWYSNFYQPRDLWVYLENYTGLSGSAPGFVSYIQHFRGGGQSRGGNAGAQTVAGQFDHNGETITYAVFFNLAGQLLFDIYDDNDVLIEQHFDGDLMDELRALPPSAWEDPAGPAQGSVSCAMSGTSTWGSGFSTTLTVHNITSQPVEDWQVRLDFNQQVNLFGNGEVFPTYNGNSVTLTQQWYRDPLPAGASVTFTVGGNFPSPQPFVPPTCTGL